MNKWTRQIHRWLSVAFLVGLVVVLATTRVDEPPGPLTFVPLVALLLLLLTGLYLFVVPYATRWRKRRRRTAPSPGG